VPHSLPELEIDQLTVLQRLELIAVLWDSIPDSLDGMPVPDWHQQELDRRLTAAAATPEAAIPWDVARSELRRDKP
jgi:putative addiction module component (TIGR02574 family)